MAAPAYNSKTAIASSVNSVSVDFTGQVAANDALLIFVESENQPIASITGMDGKITDQGSGTPGAAGATAAQWFYKLQATGSETTFTVGDSGDHTVAIGIVIRPESGKTIVIDATAGTSGQSVASGANISLDGVTTTVADALVVHGCATDRDAGSSTNFGTATNGNLTSLTERHDQSFTAGDGGGIGIWTGEKATAGATGDTTVVNNGGATILFATNTIALAHASAGSTGTLSTTEAADTAAIAGDVIVQGALASAEAGDTAALLGDVIVQGALSASDAADTAAMAGRVVVTGSLGTSEAGDTASLAGGVAVGGSLAASEAADSAAAAGNVLIDGTLAASEASDTIAIAGQVVVLGTLAATESADSAAFSGSQVATGSLAASEASDTASLIGGVIIHGVFAASEGSDSASLAGASRVSGLIAANENADAATFAGLVLIQGGLAASEGADTFAATSAPTATVRVPTASRPGGSISTSRPAMIASRRPPSISTGRR